MCTSPKAPRPITFRDSKSSRPSRVRLRRRNSVSFLACWERRIRFCRDHDAQLSTIHSSTVLYRASETNGWSQEYWKGLGRYYYTIQLTTTKLHTGNSVHWMCTHFFVSQPFLIHHFLQLLLPVRKFDCDKSQTAAPKKPFFKNNMMEQFQIPQRPDCPLSEPSTYLIARYLGKHTQFNIPLQSRSKRCDVTSFLSPHAGKWGYCKSSPGSLWPLWPSPSCGYSWRSRSSG